MSVTIGLLITLGVQTGVALANQKWNSENAKAIRDIQRAHKKDAQNAMLRRDREKFERARELQIQMEFESQQERIKSLNQDFLNSFKKMAHNATLASHYPLKVSPYVISKTVLPISDAQLSNTRQEVLCILTTSNNNTFNKEVLPYLDETLSQAVARYWNGSCLNNVCYYQGMWDNKKDYCEEDIKNVKAVINSPTLSLTPFFVMGVDGNHQLYLKVRLWGMACDCCELADTGIVYSSLPVSYNNDDIQKILAEIYPLAICVVGQLVDVFYWTVGNQAPVLPHLVASGAIPVSQKLKAELTEAYAELYMTLSLGCGTSSKLLPTQDSETLQHNAIASLLNFPERSFDFLRSCLELTKKSGISNRIIESAAQALYHAGTEEGRLPIPLIDVRRLDYDDMALLTTLIDIAHKSGNTQIAKQLATLISRKIVL